MEYRILGPLEVVSEDGRPIELSAEKPRALLTCLLLHPNEVVARDRLVDALWGEQPPSSASKLVQVYVSQLRRSLGEGALETRPPGYRLRVRPEELDAARFERLLGEGRQALAAGNAELAASLLRRGLGLWRGRALADLLYSDFAANEAGRLEELRLVCLEERIAADLARGRHGEVLPELTTLVSEHPLRERLRAQLMLAHYRSGRQAEALAVYREARRTLRAELGLEPGAELRELERAILRQDAELAAPERIPASRPHLPAPLTPLVGRTRELAELRALVQHPQFRLITLAGRLEAARLGSPSRSPRQAATTSPTAAPWSSSPPCATPRSSCRRSPGRSRSRRNQASRSPPRSPARSSPASSCSSSTTWSTWSRSAPSSSPWSTPPPG